MKTYTTFNIRKTSQKEAIPGSTQVENNAGGFGWAVGNWTRLQRFLILGSEGGTYYVKEKELTKRNAEGVLACIQEDGIRTVNTIVEVSDSGRAPKNDPALFALAMCAGLGDDKTRKYALDNLSKVARIGTHLFHFAQYVEQFRGWGRALRRAVGNWYNDKDADRLAYQVVKYQQRDGWSHRDLLRLSHVKPITVQHDHIYKWVVSDNGAGVDLDLPDIIGAFGIAKTTKSVNAIVDLIGRVGLTREMIPTEFLNSTKVWDALLQKMPMTAMIRNLGKMTSVGLLKPMSNASRLVVDRLGDQEYLQRSRIHPLSVLVALKTYEQGKGFRGSLTWSPVLEIVDALDDAFYMSFGNVEPMNKRTMLALDVSGSMSWGDIAGMPGITPRVGSGAMALVTANVERQYMTTAFTDRLSEISLSPRQRLDDVIRNISGLPFGRTDCALPMTHAMKQNLEIDTFVIYTDSETWAGDIHPSQALNQYRQKTGIPARLVVVGMVSNGFTIADPNDSGMLDVVGFSTATPNLISSFGRGEL